MESAQRELVFVRLDSLGLTAESLLPYRVVLASVLEKELVTMVCANATQDMRVKLATQSRKRWNCVLECALSMARVKTDTVCAT